MQWKPEYSLGIEEIDEQHKKLLRLFSAVQDAIDQNQGWSAVHFAIIEVKNFAKLHFWFEEALMRLYGHSDCATHSVAHDEILRQFEATEAESLRQQNFGEFAEFFRDWLVNHIQKSDRRYAEHILSGATVVVTSSGK